MVKSLMMNGLILFQFLCHPNSFANSCPELFQVAELPFIYNQFSKINYTYIWEVIPGYVSYGEDTLRVLITEDKITGEIVGSLVDQKIFDVTILAKVTQDTYKIYEGLDAEMRKYSFSFSDNHDRLQIRLVPDDKILLEVRR